MKQQTGFTLIELVVVIVILGILAVVAVPKFINIQGDAREGALKGVEAAIKSAAEMVHAKAVIAGVETASAATVTIDCQWYHGAYRLWLSEWTGSNAHYRSVSQ